MELGSSFGQRGKGENASRRFNPARGQHTESRATPRDTSNFLDDFSLRRVSTTVGQASFIRIQPAEISFVTHVLCNLA